MIRGISVYLGNFPSEFDQGTIDKKLLNPESSDTLFYTIGYIVAFLVLSFVGALFQFRKFPEEDEVEDVMKGEEETRCCGLF